MKWRSEAENHKISRLIAEKRDYRDLSRQMPNIAICRGKRQISRFRTHRDKLLPLHTSDYLKYVCKFVLILALDEISIAKSDHTRLIADSLMKVISIPVENSHNSLVNNFLKLEIACQEEVFVMRPNKLILIFLQLLHSGLSFRP